MGSPSRAAATTPRALARFFGLAYAISWALTLPLLLGQNGLGLLPYVVPAGLAFLLIVSQSYGPTVAALLVSTADQRRQILVSMRRWGGGWATVVVCVVGPPAAVAVGSMTAGGREATELLAFDISSLVVTFIANLPVLLVLGGPLGEEAGWRGYALPRLQASVGPTLASVIIGCLWAMWHLPNFMIPQMGTWQGSIWMYLLLAILLSLIHTAVYNRSSGSLAAVIVLHAAVDASSRTLLPVAFADDRARGAVALLVGFSILLVGVASLGWLRQAVDVRGFAVASSP